MVGSKRTHSWVPEYPGSPPLWVASVLCCLCWLMSQLQNEALHRPVLQGVLFQFPVAQGLGSAASAPAFLSSSRWTRPFCAYSLSFSLLHPTCPAFPCLSLKGDCLESCQKEGTGNWEETPLVLWGAEFPSPQGQTLAVTSRLQEALHVFPHDWPRRATLLVGTDDWPEGQLAQSEHFLQARLNSSLPGTSPPRLLSVSLSTCGVDKPGWPGRMCVCGERVGVLWDCVTRSHKQRPELVFSG